MLCKLCNNECLALAKLGKQPLANKYPKDNEAIKKEIFWELNAMICSNCYAGQISEIVDRKHLFEDYYYLSSVNKELANHFNSLAQKIKKNKFVLDIGSNDGVLLRPLKKLGVKCLGIDPSINVAEIANKEGLKTLVGFFDESKVMEITKEYGKPDVIVAASVFTHIEDPCSFVKNLNNLIDDNGTIIIEIEYLMNIIKKYQFERFYFDRPFYYSINSLEYIFSREGLQIHDIENIEPHGGSIRVFISKKNSNHKINSVVSYMLNNEKLFLNKTKISSFQKKIDNFSGELFNKLKEFSEKKLMVCGFGAPARLATITNFAKINDNLIKYVIDDSPLKSGKLSPGMSIPIKSREFMEKNPPDIIVVFAYEYFDSIYNFTNKFKVDHYQPIPFKLLKKAKQ